MVYMIEINNTLEIDMKYTKLFEDIQQQVDTVGINQVKRDMKLNEINYALKDIMESLTIWRDDKELDDPYILKLYREFDKLIVMKQKIMEKR